MRAYRLSEGERWWMLVKPWLSLSVLVVACAHSPLWLLVAVPLHFITVVSTLHDVVHGSVRLGRRTRELALFLYGALMLQSGHSFRRTHLFHHAHFPSGEDLEGHPAFNGIFRAFLSGPTYLARLWVWTWRRHPEDRPWLWLEAAHQLAWLAVAAWSLQDAGLRWTSPWQSLNAMGVAIIPFSFVAAAWGLPLATARLQHNGLGTTPIEQTRTIHQPQIAWLLQGLGYHREHHMNPGVPALKLRDFVRATQ